VPEVAEEPPQPLGTARRAVRDDEDALADSCTGCRARELLDLGQGMPSSRPRRRGKVFVDIQETRPRNVATGVQPAAGADIPEFPAAIDELIARSASRYGFKNVFVNLA
jgi:hypothetical protein